VRTEPVGAAVNGALALANANRTTLTGSARFLMGLMQHPAQDETRCA